MKGISYTVMGPNKFSLLIANLVPKVINVDINYVGIPHVVITPDAMK